MEKSTLTTVERAGIFAVALLCLAGVGYGVYVTFFYESAPSVLIPFSVASVIGVATWIEGYRRDSRPVMALGFVLMALAPVGFAWISGLLGLLAAAYLAVSHMRGRMRLAHS